MVVMVAPYFSYPFFFGGMIFQDQKASQDQIQLWVRHQGTNSPRFTTGADLLGTQPGECSPTLDTAAPDLGRKRKSTGAMAETSN